MKNYGRVRSTVKPEAIVIDDFSVWTNTDIQDVSENVGEENEFVGFEYELTQYDKDEFILMQAQKSEEINVLVNTMLGVNE